MAVRSATACPSGSVSGTWPTPCSSAAPPSTTEQNFSLIRQLYEKGLDFRRFGAAALDLCQVAAGRVEVFGECCLSPWDYAAGSLVITEAGGIVTDFSDTAPNVLRPSSVFASNARCHSVLKELEL